MASPLPLSAHPHLEVEVDRGAHAHVEEGEGAREGEEGITDAKDAIDAQVEPAGRDAAAELVGEPDADPVVGVGASGLWES